MVNVERYTTDLARLLLDAYIKVLCVDLAADSFDEIKVNDAEIDVSHGYSDKISAWLHDFAAAGNVHPDDRESYLEFTRLSRLREAFAGGAERESLTYRRRGVGDGFRWVKMTLRKSSSFAEGKPIVMLYIEDIDDDVRAVQEISRQKQEISDQADELAAQRVELDTQRQTMSDQADELAARAGTIASQADELAVQRDELDARADTISTQAGTISDQKLALSAQAEELLQSNAALKDAFAAAMAANSAKSEFMSRMSHDIRTPLNGIIGMTAIAGVHLDDQERVADCLTKITGAGKHLLSLINDILDLSKIESGKVSLTDADFNLPELLDNLLNMTHAAIEEHGHELEVHVQGVAHEDVVGDDIRLQQVFTNIVSNAIKYTPDGGKITIDFSELPTDNPHIGRYRFVCEDNGRGMSEEFLGKLFDPFERADEASIAKVQGTGLGMTIAQNIVNMMGGTITVESQVGKGTRFTVDFRMKLQDASNMLAAELVNLPVLVVDDDQVTCESTCITLNELGMKGDWTLTGAEAVERVSAAHEAGSDYFACLIDWKMPEMDGVETTRRIRQAVGPDVPIIIISAYEWSDIEQEALEAGANGFITKPLFKSRLKAAFTEIPKSLKSDAVVHELDAVEQADYSGRRLLLVEDNDLNREIAAEILGMTGAAVESAENGQVAVDMFAASEPGYYDMVLMDVRMPVMDGYEATRAIRAMAGVRSGESAEPGESSGSGGRADAAGSESGGRADAATVPIVALTANAFLEDIEAAREAGMNEHMSKPIDLDKLLDAMGRYLG